MLLITGGAGFTGHHFVEHFLKTTDWEIATMDKLTYASHGLDRIRDINAYDERRVKFFSADIAGFGGFGEGMVKELKDVEWIIHLAAETHVDRSIEDARPFVMSNVLGTMNMLELARKLDKLKAFLYFSTDEVFGPAPEGTFYKEWDRYDCTNPYSATKAGGEELTLAYANTHGVPAFITHTMNMFGERQHPEKVIPLFMRKILADEVLTIHADPGCKIPGSRFYIHARNVANAVHFLLDKFEFREKYNIVGEVEIDNRSLAFKIGDVLGKQPKIEMVDFHSSRPGHDLRYALDGTKLADLGWQTPMTFERSLESTIKWTLERQKWLRVDLDAEESASA